MRRLLLLAALCAASLGTYAGPSAPTASASPCGWDGAAYVWDCEFYHGCNFKFKRPDWWSVGWVFKQQVEITSCEWAVYEVHATVALNSGPGPSPVDGPWIYYASSAGSDSTRHRDRNVYTQDPPPPPPNGAAPVKWDNYVNCQWHGARWISSRLMVTVDRGQYQYSTTFYSPIGEVYGMVGCA